MKELSQVHSDEKSLVGNCLSFQKITEICSSLRGGGGGGGGGVQAFHFGKNDLELGVGGDGQDTSRPFEGSFGSIRAILPMRGHGAKTGAKTRI